MDFDGDGDNAQGIKGELKGMPVALVEAIQGYATANGTGIVYDGSRNPYFFVDADCG